VEYYFGSILDTDLVTKAMRGVGQLYHLAANPNLWTRNKEDFMRVNLQGTKIAIAQAERSGVERVVYTSTESILKATRRNGRHCISETVVRSLDEMPGPYCRSKFLAEQEALAAARRGVPVVVVNPTLPVGPGDYRLTPPTRMLLNFLNGGVFAYLECELNLIDVRDVAIGHINAAERGRVGERYILGNENIRLSELLNLLQELTGLPMPKRRVSYITAFATAAISEFISDSITRRPPVAPLTGVRLVKYPGGYDSRKAVKELGLPQTPLRTSLADAINWFAEQGKLKRNPAGLRTDDA
jgi:dihydroflavonol-4-reductase